jgi:hypothetical protein
MRKLLSLENPSVHRRPLAIAMVLMLVPRRLSLLLVWMLVSSEAGNDYEYER